MASKSQPKSDPSASNAPASVLPALPRKPPVGSRSIPQARHGPKSTTNTDYTSERATAALIRRVLCAPVAGHGSEQRERGTPRPLEEMLPPLTSSNEVDLQLYALIAIIMKEFVYAWYSKITPDHSFTAEVIQVIAHCTRALEQRLRHVDVHALVLDEIPSLIEAHIVAYRMASQSAVAARYQTQFRASYHALNPHPALSPVPEASVPGSTEQQLERESIYRQMLAQGTLAVLLPPEDLENVCLRTLVGDILADLLLGEIVGDKIAEGWFIWEIITKLARELKPGPDEKGEVEQIEKSRLECFGLLSTPREDDIEGHDSVKGQSSISNFFWTFLQYVYLVYAAIRFVILELAQVVSSSSFMPVRGLASTVAPKTPATESQPLSSSSTARLPILKYRLFGMASQLVDVSRRMPWLGGSLALAQHVLLKGPGRLGETDGLIDRLLRQTIQKHLFTSALLPSLLLAARSTVFPANARPVSPEASSEADTGIQSGSSRQPLAAPASISTPLGPEDQKEELTSDQRTNNAKINSIKRACAQSVLQLIPRPVALAILAIPTDKEFYHDATNDLLGAEESRHNPASHRSPPPAHAAAAPPTPVLPSLNPSTPLSGAAGTEARPRSSKINFHPSRSNPGAIIGMLTPDLSSGGMKIDRSSNSNSISSSRTERADLSPLLRHPLSREEEERLCCAAIERDILDLFSDSYCNKHLVYSIVEAVLVKLIPELTEHGVGELMAERGL